MSTAMNTYHLQINGSTNTRWTHRLESRLLRMGGVTTASATPTGQLVVRGRAGLLPLITRTLSDAGYEVASDQTAPQMPFARWYRTGWLTEPRLAA